MVTFNHPTLFHRYGQWKHSAANCQSFWRNCFGQASTISWQAGEPAMNKHNRNKSLTSNIGKRNTHDSVFVLFKSNLSPPLRHSPAPKRPRPKPQFYTLAQIIPEAIIEVRMWDHQLWKSRERIDAILTWSSLVRTTSLHPWDKSATTRLRIAFSSPRQFILKRNSKASETII